MSGNLANHQEKCRFCLDRISVPSTATPITDKVKLDFATFTNSKVTRISSKFSSSFFTELGAIFSSTLVTTPKTFATHAQTRCQIP